VVPESDQGARGEAVLLCDVPSPSQQGSKAEQEFRRQWEADGYRVIKNGWPDFLCFRVVGGSEEAFAAEVKSGGASMSREQRFVAALLARAGLDVVLAHPDRGLVKLDGTEDIDELFPPPFSPGTVPCACGCGEMVKVRPVYFSPACRVRAMRRRKA